MRDLRDLLDRLRAAPDAAPLALATIVRVVGSSYRREGARLLIEGDGRMTGMLSAGCLERDLAARALALAQGAHATVIEYDLTAEGEAIWGSGTGCAGHVTLLIEPLDAAARALWTGRLASLLEERRELRLATVWRAPAAPRAEAPAVGASLARFDRSLCAGLDRDDSTAPPARAAPGSNPGAPVKGAAGEDPSRRFAAAEGDSPLVAEGTNARAAAAWIVGDPDSPTPSPSLPAFSSARGVAAAPSGAPEAAGAPPRWIDLAERELRRLAGGEARTVELDGEDRGVALLLEAIPPPVHLLLLGGERDAPPLARFAVELGWQVTVVEGREAPDAAARFGAGVRHLVVPPRALRGAVELSRRTALLLATHRYLDDLAYLAEIDPESIGYLALLGPKSRRARLLADLERIRPGAAAALDARLAGPAGLDLGGRRPEEVALAIVAEIQARFSGRDARALGRPGSSASPSPATS